jgi:protein-tyrosine phosphatase
MIDIHSHVLFDMDDGAEDIETSIELCRDSYMNGCDAIVLTPHFL